MWQKVFRQFYDSGLFTNCLRHVWVRIDRDIQSPMTLLTEIIHVFFWTSRLTSDIEVSTWVPASWLCALIYFKICKHLSSICLIIHCFIFFYILSMIVEKMLALHVVYWYMYLFQYIKSMYVYKKCTVYIHCTCINILILKNNTIQIKLKKHWFIMCPYILHKGVYYSILLSR